MDRQSVPANTLSKHGCPDMENKISSKCIQSLQFGFIPFLWLKYPWSKHLQILTNISMSASPFRMYSYSPKSCNGINIYIYSIGFSIDHDVSVSPNSKKCWNITQSLFASYENSIHTTIGKSKIIHFTRRTGTRNSIILWYVFMVTIQEHKEFFFINKCDMYSVFTSTCNDTGFDFIWYIQEVNVYYAFI